MTPQEKARKLVYDHVASLIKNSDVHFNYKKAAIQCALISVDEILNISYFTHEPSEDDDLYMNYWKQVKEEILKCN